MVQVQMPVLETVRDTIGIAPFPEAKEHILEVKNLNIYYGEKRAVNDISMHVDKHAVTALIGRQAAENQLFKKHQPDERSDSISQNIRRNTI